MHRQQRLQHHLLLLGRRKQLLLLAHRAACSGWRAPRRAVERAAPAVLWCGGAVLRHMKRQQLQVDAGLRRLRRADKGHMAVLSSSIRW
jgi:hypothetical protein